MGMKHPLYHDPARSTINLGLPWHSIAEEIADLNLKIVNGHIYKRMKPCHPAKRLGPKEFLTGIGYLTHNLEGYVLYPESLVIPSKPPPMEQTAKNPLFCLLKKHPDVLREWIEVTSGLFSLHASQLKEHKALARKTAAAFSNALSIANMCTISQRSLRNPG